MKFSEKEKLDELLEAEVFSSTIFRAYLKGQPEGQAVKLFLEFINLFKPDQFKERN